MVNVITAVASVMAIAGLAFYMREEGEERFAGLFAGAAFGFGAIVVILERIW